MCSSLSLREMNVPTLAAINGACAGVGMAYALQCDLRFAAKKAKFTTAFSRRGLIGEYGMAWLLSSIAGRQVTISDATSGGPRGLPGPLALAVV